MKIAYKEYFLFNNQLFSVDTLSELLAIHLCLTIHNAVFTLFLYFLIGGCSVNDDNSEST